MEWLSAAQTEIVVTLFAQFCVICAALVKLYREIRKTHTLVNSRIDEFKVATEKVMAAAILDARAEGFKAGAAGERDKSRKR
jgi:hypothetical protein